MRQIRGVISDFALAAKNFQIHYIKKEFFHPTPFYTLIKNNPGPSHKATMIGILQVIIPLSWVKYEVDQF